VDSTQCLVVICMNIDHLPPGPVLIEQTGPMCVLLVKQISDLIDIEFEPSQFFIGIIKILYQLPTFLFAGALLYDLGLQILYLSLCLIPEIHRRV